MSIKQYIRKAVMASLGDYCHLADQNDIIEVSQWSTGEGWDITIDSKHNTRTFSLTDGEMKALIVLTNIAEAEGEED